MAQLVTAAVDATTRIAHVALQAAPVNALTPALLTAIRNTVRALDPSKVRGMILTSTLPRVYSAGLDLRELVREKSETPAQFRARAGGYLSLFQDCVATLASCEIPSVAVVHGASPAGGTVLALTCDYRIAAEDSTVPLSMGLNETRVGMNPPPWVHGLARLSLSPRFADRYLQFGILVNSSRQAFETGFVDRLVPQSRLFESACEEIEEMCKTPSQARTACKRLLRKDLLAAMNQESLDIVLDSVTGEEFQSTVGGILEALKSKKSKP